MLKRSQSQKNESLEIISFKSRRTKKKSNYPDYNYKIKFQGNKLIYIGLYILVFLLWVVVELIMAPTGYEDEKGFHYEKEN